MADSERFIDGIYNYCDRWCARCPLSARCRLYALEQQLGEAGPDIDAADFWAALGTLAASDSELFDSELVDELSDEDFGFGSQDDDGSELLSDELLAEALEREEQVDRHPLVESATAYGIDVGRWLHDHGDQAKSAKLSSDAPITPDDVVAVIGWYGMTIGAKLTRAISAQMDLDDEASWETESDWRGEAEETAETIGEVARDEAAGSAKVALLGIERSLGAWTIMRDLMPARDAEIVALQKRLGRLRRQVDELFPEARTFHRPGFDDRPRGEL